jgi:hypothetical protein
MGACAKTVPSPLPWCMQRNALLHSGLHTFDARRAAARMCLCAAASVHGAGAQPHQCHPGRLPHQLRRIPHVRQPQQRPSMMAPRPAPPGSQQQLLAVAIISASTSLCSPLC